jgi:hypothetical protein
VDWDPRKHPRDPDDGRFTDSWVGAALRRMRLPSWIEKVTPEQAETIRAGLVGEDKARRYMRLALTDTGHGGQYDAVTHVARDEGGQVVAAVSTRAYKQWTEESDDLVPLTGIDYLGSIAPGGGTALVRNTILRAWEAGHAGVYLEPGEGSLGFWERLGFTPDPLEFGTDAHYGLTADQFEQWLAEH